MALTFGGATTDIVSIGSGASIDNLDPFTLLYWVNPTALTNTKVLYRKGAGLKNFRISGASGDVQMLVNRAGGNTSYITNTTPLAATGTWVFLASSFDSAAAAGELVNIYKGTLAAAATECTYGTATDSSGAITDDSAGDASFGNGIWQTNAFQGAIATFAIVNRKLTPGEIVSWQFQPRMVAGCVALCHCGFSGATTQTDYSGNGNSGAITGATVSAHVPLVMPFNARPPWIDTEASAPPTGGNPWYYYRNRAA